MVNYPNFVACPYNAMHRCANTELLTEHMLVCDCREKAHVFSEVIEPQRDCEELIHTDNIRKFNLELEDWDNN